MKELQKPLNNLDKLFDNELEDAVIGAILIEKSAYEDVAGTMNIDLFYNPLNREIFTCLSALNEEKTPIDLISVTQKHRVLYPAKPSPGYELSLKTDRVNSSANIKYHTTFLHQLSLKRGLFEMATSIIKVGIPTESFALLGKIKSEIQRLENCLPKMQASSFADIFAETIKKAEIAMQNKVNGANGIDTGISDLNLLTGGWQTNNLVLIGGRPGMGKTSIAIHFIYKAALSGVKVAFFSLEMQKDELMRKLISTDLAHKGTKISSSKMKKGYLTQTEFQNMCEAKIQQNGNIIIYDQPGMHLSYIRSEINAIVRENNVKMVVIDYLQMIKCLESGSTIRHEIVDHICKELKEIAKEHNITLILLSQLNTRTNEPVAPHIGNLKESSGVEESADIIIFPYRPYYYQKDKKELEHELELHIGKNRDGNTGVIDIHCDMEFGYFYDKNEDNVYPG